MATSTIFSQIGDALTTALTGQSMSDLSAEATAAEQQIAVAVSAIIALEAIIVAELFIILIMQWKERH